MANVHSQIVDYSGQRVARITVDNTAKINILNTPLINQLIAEFAELATDEELRAVILSGAGERAFIGGADIRELAQLDVHSAERFISNLQQACGAIRSLPVPVIASIQGYCLGAGLEVAASCDIRISAATAVFAMPEVKVGIPSVIEAALLPRLIGWGRTSQLLYTGESIDAQKALAWGFVEDVVPATELPAAVDAIVASIVSCGAKAIRAQKALMRQWEVLPLEQAVEQGIKAFSEAYQTDEPSRMLNQFINRKHL